MARNRLSENTALAYYSDAVRFVEFVEKKSITDFRKIDKKIINSFIGKLKREKKSPSTIARNVASIRRFFDFLISAKEVELNPAVMVKPPKLSKGLPEVLTAEEISRILEQPRGLDAKSVRDRAMLELLYAIGSRVSEIISLNVSDVNIKVGYIKCRKNDEERIIPIGKMALFALEDYLNSARELIASDEEQALFVNMSGYRMSRQGFWKLVKYYADSAGIEKQITPHTLRHSFAAHLLENGADINSVRTMLGHADISSTLVYEKLVQNKLRNIYKKSHPRA